MNKADLLQFLKNEYLQDKQTPKVIRLLGHEYVVPYPYVRDFQDYQKAFMNDFFDLMKKDYLRYKHRNEEPRYICLSSGEKDVRLVVPYALRYKQSTAKELAHKIFQRADTKYWKAVNLSAKLAEIYPERPFQTLVSLSQLKDMRNAYRMNQFKEVRDKTAYITKKVGNFLAKNARKATDNIKSVDVEKLKKKARTWAVATMLGATITAAVYSAFQIKDNIEQKKEIPDKNPLNHAQMFSRCHDAIKVSLAFAENFAPNAFKDGVGVPTIGYGCTYYLDENGNGSLQTSPVKKGDKITKEEANVQKERYLQFEILKQIQENVKVPMDEATTIATYNFAYVLGSTNFRKSEYLKALNEGKKGAELAKYLTGYRQQKGLLPRFYFMGALLNGKLKTSDLLNLTAEGCYNLSVKDVCYHKGNKLLLDEEGFASFNYDKLADNLQKACKTRRSKACGNKKCPTVNEILPQSVIDGVLQMEKSRTYTGLLSDKLLNPDNSR